MRSNEDPQSRSIEDRSIESCRDLATRLLETSYKDRPLVPSLSIFSRSQLRINS